MDDEEKELEDYRKLVEESHKNKDFAKVKEVPIMKDMAEMNLNEATRFNAGSPAVGQKLNENSPWWAKTIFGVAAFLWIILLIAGLLLVAWLYTGSI